MAVDERTVLMIVHSQTAASLLASTVRQLDFAAEAARGNARADVAEAFDRLGAKLEEEMMMTLDSVRLLAKSEVPAGGDKPSEGTEP